jgi:hypothetical protein
VLQDGGVELRAPATNTVFFGLRLRRAAAATPVPPVARDGFRRNLQRFGSLLDRHATEIAKFDDAALAAVDARELVERLVECEDGRRTPTP